MKSRACSALLAIVTGLAFSPSVAVVVPARAEVSRPDLPPSAPGRLAYTTSELISDGVSSGNVPRGIGTVGLDGTDERVLTEPNQRDENGYRGFDYGPQWSPDGRWLVYLQDRPRMPGLTNGVVALPRDGGDVEVIDAAGVAPAWSADGRLLAWISKNSDASGGLRLVMAEVDTTASSLAVNVIRTIPLPATTEHVAWPAFSPDGTRIALAQCEELSWECALSTFSVTGEDVVRLAESLVIDDLTRYSFSPDGSKLLFIGAHPGANDKLAYVVNTDGTGLHAVSTFWTERAVWSPSGSTIALFDWPQQGFKVVNLDGDVLRTLAPGAFQYWDGVTWSPDGSQLFTAGSLLGSDDSGSHVFAIPLDGSDPVQLTHGEDVWGSSIQAVDPGSVIREFASGPVDTAADVVADALSTAETVVISPTDDFASALAAAPLAAALDAPQLLTRPDDLSPAVLRAVEHLEATRAVVVGPAAPAVVDGLQSAGLQVTHLASTTSPYRNSAAIARRFTSRSAFVVPVGADDARPWRLPLATAGLAAFTKRPILYTTHRGVPSGVAAAIRDQGITSVTLVGDDRVVRPRLLGQLGQLGVRVVRVRSNDTYALSARFAQRATELGAEVVSPVVGSGSSWPSSAVAPALAALLGQVTVLVDRETLENSPRVATWLGMHTESLHTATLVGGAGTVRPRVEMQLERLAR